MGGKKGSPVTSGWPQEGTRRRQRQGAFVHALRAWFAIRKEWRLTRPHFLGDGLFPEEKAQSFVIQKERKNKTSINHSCGKVPACSKIQSSKIRMKDEMKPNYCHFLNLSTLFSKMYYRWLQCFEILVILRNAFVTSPWYQKLSKSSCFLIKAEESLWPACIGEDAVSQILGCSPPGVLSARLQEEVLVQWRRESNRSPTGKPAAADPATYSEGDTDHDEHMTKP